MSEDPLAQFRRGQPPRKEEPEPQPEYEQAQASDEHRALRAAIEVLNQIPNTPLSGEYKNTYALIPVLETVYNNAERELRQQPQAHISMTDAEIEAAAKHDIEQWDEAKRQLRLQGRTVESREREVAAEHKQPDIEEPDIEP
jgi:hypothetical protein